MFVKVVEKGSFTQASLLLGVPKATLSRKMQELEQRLGTPLMRRSTRKLALTEAGQLYFDHCARIVRELDDAESAINQLRGAPRGWIRITAPYSMGTQTLAPLLPEFMTRYPDVRIDMVLTNEVLDIIGADIDVALRVGSLGDSSLHARLLARLSGCVFASPEYLSRYGEPLRPEDLIHHRAITMAMQRRNQRVSWPLGDGVTQGEYPVNPVMVSNEPDSLRRIAEAGVGLVFLPEKLGEASVQTGRLIRVLGAWRSPPFDLNAVFPRGGVLAPKVRAFVDFLVEKTADLLELTPEAAR